MKIKTITCHDVYNVGASLQAYALVTYLRSLGHEAEIIDYKPDYLRHYRLWGVSNSVYDKPIVREMYNLAKLPERIKARTSRRKKEYDYFTETFLPVTEQRYHSNDELKHNPPEADVFFAGSDQIWNTFFKNGKDPAFYLDFAPKTAIRASYAASFATKDIAEEWKPQITRWLTALDYISVRENSGVEMIQKLGVDGAVAVVDPVFLLDAGAWTKMEKEMHLSEPYLLLYDFDRSAVIGEFAKKIAMENGWKIYSVLSCEYCDRCFNEEGPQAFVSLVHNAQFVVSNSFHATAFSLIFQKQFAVFDRIENINTRMRDLLSDMGLQNCLVKERNHRCYKIDYEQISEKLYKRITESKAFIDKVLSGEKKSGSLQGNGNGK